MWSNVDSEAENEASDRGREEVMTVHENACTVTAPEKSPAGFSIYYVLLYNVAQSPPWSVRVHTLH